MKRQLTHASLFSGIGGFDLAAEWAGLKNLFNCDTDTYCRQVLKYHFPYAEQYTDIRTTDFSVWRGQVDVLSGGFPCQPFSLAGKRRGADDDRYLWPAMLEVIRTVRPTWVIGENVFGIASMVLPGTVVDLDGKAVDGFEGVEVERQRYVLNTICEELEQEGYSVQPFVIPACSVGAPHRRDRIWIIARLRDDGSSAADSGSLGCYDGRNNRCGGYICDNGVGDAAQNHQERSGRERGIGSSYEDLGASSNAGGFGRTSGGLCGNGQSPQECQGHQLRSIACGSCQERTVADSCGQRYERGLDAKRPETAVQQYSARSYTRAGTAERPKPDWSQFPTQPPLHARNDGFPRQLAGQPFSDSKWRAESVKACGNAIVPQVAYEIFRFIVQIEDMCRNKE